MSPTFRALHNHNYRLYAAGGVLSNTGTWMQRVAQDWLVVLLATNAGTALGITTGLQFLPALLLSPVAGLVADRVSKQRLLQVTQGVMGVTALVLGLLTVTGNVQVWHVYVLAFVLGVGVGVRRPGPAELRQRDGRPGGPHQRGGPELRVLQRRPPASARRCAGPPDRRVRRRRRGHRLGDPDQRGQLRAGARGPWQKMVLADLNVTPREARHKGMIRDAVRYLRGRPDLMLIMSTVFFAGTFGLNFQLTSALMATQVFDKGATQFGLLGSALAIGSLSGALLAAPAHDRAPAAGRRGPRSSSARWRSSAAWRRRTPPSP